MLVTKIENKTSTKFKVYLDGQFAFVLKKSELFRYRIKENEQLSECDYEEIRNEIIKKRAKLRALQLLTDMDRTKDQLCKKLRDDGYQEDIIDETIGYVESFGYVNDFNFAKNFIESKKNKKSKKEMYSLLKAKGLSSEMIENAMEECYSNEDTVQAIEQFLRKKRFRPENMSEKELQKIYSALARKGFHYEDIRHVIQVSEWNA
ncbi:MAG: regulatory protein RecX [Eubacteriales bacterium]|nr:regulatory protein RecX [Eubacteriales bacterium]